MKFVFSGIVYWEYSYNEDPTEAPFSVEFDADSPDDAVAKVSNGFEFELGNRKARIENSNIKTEHWGWAHSLRGEIRRKEPVIATVNSLERRHDEADQTYTHLQFRRMDSPVAAS